MRNRFAARLVNCVAIGAACGVTVSAAAQTSSVPRSAFYAAIGGGYARTDFDTQVDVSYMYAKTKKQTFSYSSAFTNPSALNNSTTIGMFIGNSSGRVETQTVLVTIGKTF